MSALTIVAEKERDCENTIDHILQHRNNNDPVSNPRSTTKPMETRDGIRMSSSQSAETEQRHHDSLSSVKTTNNIDTSPTKREQDLKQRVQSLEQQITTMHIAMQHLIETLSASKKHPSSSSSPDKVPDDDTKEKRPITPPLDPSIQAVNSLVLLESPSEGECKMITPHVENDDATSSSTTPKSQPTPALVVEYRSYTSDYEDELRKLRKNSRGVSFDTTNADTSKPATISESNEKSDKDESKQQTQASSAQKVPATTEKNTKKLSFFESLDSLQDGSASEECDIIMEEFLRVPFQLEGLLFFGLAICVDSFLQLVTVVPLKFIWSCICFVCTVIKPKKGIGFFSFHRRHLYQVIRVFVIYAVYRYCLCTISIGKMYHWIRGQVMFKLYLLMAIVEVFDRLMCSFGQDALDSLYWNTTRKPYHTRMLISTMVVFFYVMIHSLILLLHIATLNVAMNSADQALLSLLIGGNFAEIKSTVFKKYNKQNLFKITTSDICERFKLVLFLGLILLLNCCQGGMNEEKVFNYVYMSGFIMASESLCDWIKHSFITKFNYIKSSAYSDYALILAGDIKGVGLLEEGVNIDHAHAVVKRIGFSSLPLICVVARYLKEASRYADMLSEEADSTNILFSIAEAYTNGNWVSMVKILLTIYFFLLLLKIILGHFISNAAYRIIHNGGGQDENELAEDKKGGPDKGKSTQRRQAV